MAQTATELPRVVSRGGSRIEPGEKGYFFAVKCGACGESCDHIESGVVNPGREVTATCRCSRCGATWQILVELVLSEALELVGA